MSKRRGRIEPVGGVDEDDRKGLVDVAERARVTPLLRSGVATDVSSAERLTADLAEPMDEAVPKGGGDGVCQTRIRNGELELFRHRSISVGGLGSGPSPFQLLASASSTEGRGGGTGVDPADRSTRRIETDGDLDEALMAQLIEIARRWPALLGGARIEGPDRDGSAPIRRSTDQITGSVALIAAGRGFFEDVQ